MPWTRAQNRLFRAAEHDPKIAKDAGISQEDAARMAHEGVKGDSKAAGDDNTGKKKKPRHERLYKDKT